MTNWKTNLGGAVSAMGTTLIGVGVLPQIAGQHSDVLWWIALCGFVLSAVGKFITSIFTADTTVVKNIAAAVDKINQTGSDPGSVPAIKTDKHQE